MFGTVLMAEDDLRVLRDLCISYGQGYFLGRPDLEPRLQIPDEAQSALSDQRVTSCPSCAA